MTEIKRRRGVTLRPSAGERTTLNLTPAAVQVFGKWNSKRAIELFLRFSVAQGGPSKFSAAFDYWSADERLTSGGAAMEAAIWWSVGTAPQPAQKGSE